MNDGLITSFILFLLLNEININLRIYNNIEKFKITLKHYFQKKILSNQINYKDILACQVLKHERFFLGEKRRSTEFNFHYKLKGESLEKNIKKLFMKKKLNKFYL